MVTACRLERESGWEPGPTPTSSASPWLHSAHENWETSLWLSPFESILAKQAILVMEIALYSLVPEGCVENQTQVFAQNCKS